MNYETIKIIALIVGISSPIIAWIWRTSARVGKLEIRQDMLINSISHLPSNKDLSNLTLAIEKMNGSIKELSTLNKVANKRMDKLEQTIERVEQYLLNNKDK